MKLGEGRFKVIVGLGNPGIPYKATRHNVGFLAVERLARKRRALLKLNRSLKSRTAEADFQNRVVCLALPQTFMNLSGEAVSLLLRNKHATKSDLLVVCDDVCLPLGNLRMRARGGDGGHKGLASIIAELETEDFARLRLGIGKDDANKRALSDYVLSRFKRGEAVLVNKMLLNAVEAIEMWLSQGPDRCMNRFNKKRGVA